jgi:uncharacterized protein (DUF488 family)
MTIWTLGHSNRSLEEFLELLTAHRIESIADVRSYPGSKKFPHFNREALRAALAEVSVSYRHFPGLGGRRREPEKPNRHSAWRVKGFRAYAEHMEREAFTEAIAELLRIAAETRTALMCAEALWWRCHRQLIADFLKAHGHTVLHIMKPGETEEHPYSSAARIVDGRLSYEA